MVIMSTSGRRCRRPGICSTRLFQILHLIVHHVAARLPKGLARNEFTGCLTLELEENPALQHVPEHRSRMSMWAQPVICGG